MFIAQGANDPRVKQAESEQIVKQCRSRGIPHEYLLFPDEGHGFVKPGNRLKFYAAAEKFLATHLGGRLKNMIFDFFWICRCRSNQDARNISNKYDGNNGHNNVEPQNNPSCDFSSGMF